MDVKNVLIIEDDDSIVELLSIHLKDLGCSVVAASNGINRVQKTGSGSFDLIILDIMLPGLNGMEICRKIRQTDRHTPILMLTARSEEIDKVLGLETGADDYITKPFSVREFLARVKVIFRRKEENLETPAVMSPSSVLCRGTLEIDLDEKTGYASPKPHRSFAQRI